MPELVERGIVINDYHGPYQSMPCHRILVQVLSHFKFQRKILNGDIYDVASLSKHRMPGPDTPMFQEEILAANDFIYELMDAKGGRDAYTVFNMGNHEDRYNRHFREAINTPLAGAVDVQSAFMFDQWGGVDEFNELHDLHLPVLENGVQVPLAFTHGYKHGQAVAKGMLMDLGISSVSGHTHRPDHYSQTYGDGSIRAAWVTGCLTDLAPEYMKRRFGRSKWTQGFGMFYLFDDGSFHFKPVEIWKGMAVVEGKVFDGNE